MLKIELLVIGKIKQDFILRGILEYEKRLQHFVKFGITRLPAIKVNSSKPSDIILLESGKFISNLSPADHIVLLDINGDRMDTIHFSNFVEKKINSFPGKTVFIIGGAYGVSDELKKQANYKLSLSKLTFTHDMSQLILLEQIYRAYTILNNIPYHH